MTHDMRCPICRQLIEAPTVEAVAEAYARHVSSHPPRCPRCGGDVLRQYDELACIQCCYVAQTDPFTGQLMEYKPYAKGPEDWPPLKNPMGEKHTGGQDDE